MVGILKQFKHTSKNVGDSISSTTKNTVETVSHPAYNYYNKASDLASSVGKRLGEQHDVLGIKGNYKKHYQWINSTDGRQRAVREMWDMPLASDRVATHVFHAGDKDRDLTKEYSRYATAGIAPEALILNSSINNIKSPN